MCTSDRSQPYGTPFVTKIHDIQPTHARTCERSAYSSHGVRGTERRHISDHTRRCKQKTRTMCSAGLVLIVSLLANFAVEGLPPPMDDIASPTPLPDEGAGSGDDESGSEGTFGAIVVVFLLLQCSCCLCCIVGIFGVLPACILSRVHHRLGIV